MQQKKKKQKKSRQIFLSCLGAMIVGYFLYHTIEGDRGWFAMLHMQREIKTAEATLSKLQGERKELEHRTQLLKNDSMDPDLLDEKSRELLNYSKPNEIVIIAPENQETEKR